MKKISGRVILSTAPLLLLAIWATAVGINRSIVYSEAREQSREFAPAVAANLREGRLDEAMSVADHYTQLGSHLAMVLKPGLQEFKAFENDATPSPRVLEAVRRAMERAQSIEHVELEQGLPQLWLIAVISPIVGLIVTLLLVMNSLRAFAGRLLDMNGLAGAMGQNLIPLTAGLLVAIFAFYLFNDFSTHLRGFDVEMQNTSSELVDYFARRIELVKQ
jgi:biopolymer transport protein ExbB/biopolymer transport protein TolQ